MWLGVAGFSAGLVLGPAMAYVGGPPESVRIFECAVYGIALGIVADLFASIIRWDKGGSARARDQGVIRQFTLRALLFGVAILAVYCACLPAGHSCLAFSRCRLASSESATWRSRPARR